MQIVKITWVDSATFKEWYNNEDVRKLERTYMPEITSVGYLVLSTKNNYVLALNNDYNDAYSCITIIPKCSVTKKEIIKNEKESI